MTAWQKMNVDAELFVRRHNMLSLADLRRSSRLCATMRNCPLKRGGIRAWRIS
jgi:hypothetical protein